MPVLASHGVEAFYRDEGDGSPVILGHSSTGSSGQWRSLIDRLSARYRFLAPDHLGYGRTGPYPGGPSVIEHDVSIITGLANLLDEPVHLVGHSYGGAMVSRAAIQMPGNVRSLTLIEPTLFHLLRPAGRDGEYAEIKAVADRVVHYVDAGDTEEAARGFIEYWVGRNAFDSMEARIRSAVTDGMPKLRAEWLEAFDARGATIEALRDIEAPIQLIRGGKSTGAAKAVVDLLREILPGAGFVEIEEAGHMLPLTHPQRVNPMIERFLDEHRASE